MRYMAFDPDDDTSDLGVTVDMRPNGVFDFFCSTNGSSCFKGDADCRVSASLMNNRVMITEENRFAGIMSRTQGIVFNQTTVETRLAKCSYVYDGATDRRLNGGCGCGALGQAECSDIMSAYYDRDCAFSDTFDANACRESCQANDTATCIQANPTSERV